MTALEQLGAFVATHQPDQRARAEVRLHTADVIGAWIAACGTAEGRMLLAFRKLPAHATKIENLQAWLTRLTRNVCADG